MAVVEERVLTVGGMELHVKISGEGAPLLLLHGFTGSTATWHAHVLPLSLERRPILLDLPGHGGSAAPADPARYALSSLAVDLTGVLDLLRLPHVDLLGYSLGARVALHLAILFPERVRSLILESGSPGLENEAERAARRAADERLAERIERDGIRPFVEYWEGLPLFATMDQISEAERRRVREERLSQDPGGLANSLRGAGTGAQDSLWDRLGGIHAPTLVLAGALDEKYVAVGRTMAEALPRAQLQIVPGAGHTVHLERPALFTRSVRTFLGDVERDIPLL